MGDRYCGACGMPLDNPADFAGGDMAAGFCKHCVDDAGRVRSCAEIFEGGVSFFMDRLGLDRQAAERVTRKNMGVQPHWQGRDCPELRGEMASDAEFAAALEKLAG